MEHPAIQALTSVVENRSSVNSGIDWTVEGRSCRGPIPLFATLPWCPILRRCAAVAAPLCPGLVCDCSFGAECEAPPGRYLLTSFE